jgi:hypothetical protein
MSFSNGIPNLYVNGNVCVNGTVNIKATSSIVLNLGHIQVDPAGYGMVQITNPVNNIDRSSFSFVRYSTGDYWQIGATYGSLYGLGFYGSSGRFQNSSATPCFTIMSNSAGINKSSTDIAGISSFSYTLDVSGTGRFKQNLQSGDLTCNTLSVTTINQWYITRDVSGLYRLPSATTTTNPGNIGSTGFGNVYVQGYASASSWNFSTATFRAPSNGIYMFQLNVFDISANSQYSIQNRCLLMIGSGMSKYNSGSSFEYLMFSQNYNTKFGSYTVTRTVYLNSGETIYYNQNGAIAIGQNFAPLYWVYGNGYTNLTITQLC